MLGELPGGRFYLASMLAIDLSDFVEHGRKAGAAEPIVRRKVSPAIEGFEIGSQENRQRPSTRAGHDLYGVHVDLVDVRALFSIHFDGDEVLVH